MLFVSDQINNVFERTVIGNHRGLEDHSRSSSDPRGAAARLQQSALPPL